MNNLELVVRNGRWFTIGDNGAEFFDYQNGDIIFNASQTRELLRSGRVRSNGGRGLLIGDGSAYVGGNAFALVEDTTGSKRTVSASNTTASGKLKSSTTSTKKSTSSSSKKKSSSSKKKSTSKDSDNTFDWIEVAIERIEREITNLSHVAESSFRTLAQRLTATEKLIAEIYSEIAIQQQASDYYMQKADSVGLSDALKKKVREGAIDIKSYKKETQKLITEYKKWYDKALKASDAVEELNISLGELYSKRFDAVQDDLGNQLSLLEHMTNSYNHGLDEIEARGMLGGEQLYRQMQAIQQQNIQLLEAQLAAMIQAMSSALNSGAIAKGSAEW